MVPVRSEGIFFFLHRSSRTLLHKIDSSKKVLLLGVKVQENESDPASNKPRKEMHMRRMREQCPQEV